MKEVVLKVADLVDGKTATILLRRRSPLYKDEDEVEVAMVIGSYDKPEDVERAIDRDIDGTKTLGWILMPLSDARKLCGALYEVVRRE